VFFPSLSASDSAPPENFCISLVSSDSGFSLFHYYFPLSLQPKVFCSFFSHTSFFLSSVSVSLQFCRSYIILKSRGSVLYLYIHAYACISLETGKNTKQNHRSTPTQIKVYLIGSSCINDHIFYFIF
jgi:hypothetical protein